MIFHILYLVCTGLLLLGTLTQGYHGKVGGPPKYPIVIIPGDGGSQLEAKLINREDTPHWFCSKNSDWYSLWLDPTLLAPGAVDCWAENIRLRWNPEDGTYHNTQGVETRTPGWYSTDTIEYLDPGLKLVSGYFDLFVGAMVRKGYRRYVDIVGAPYDFRFAPASAQGLNYTSQLKNLIQEVSRRNGGKRVILLGHSMGCLYGLFMLQRESPEWTQKYIRAFIPIAGPWGGAAKIMRLFASGDDQGVAFVDPLAIRAEQRSYESNLWLAPNPELWKDEILATTNHDFRAYNYSDWFKAIKYPEGYVQMEKGGLHQLIKNMEHPGVDIFCLYSLGIDTPKSFFWPDGNFDEQPKTYTGDGDGTVNDISLKWCEAWGKQKVQNSTFSSAVFQGYMHQDMVRKDEVIARLIEYMDTL